MMQHNVSNNYSKPRFGKIAGCVKTLELICKSHNRIERICVSTSSSLTVNLAGGDKRRDTAVTAFPNERTYVTLLVWFISDFAVLLFFMCVFLCVCNVSYRIIKWAQPYTVEFS